MKHHPLRCAYCKKVPRGKSRIAERKKYAPFCSYHCQEWGNLREVACYLESLKAINEGAN